MTSFEIRQRFIEYFRRQGHVPVASSSLIPEDDPTLLFTNAGMNQFKNVFLGLEQRDYKRAVSVQKCIRAGGKHNDLENVGFTARHHTFFEMQGNFSFGDYFKTEAIHFAWDYLTKDLGLPKEKLYVTVFEKDDEAAKMWHERQGVPKERIFRFGEKDNFWRMGDTGPCGPCSEIFYDHGPKAGKESDPYKGIVAGEDRFVEIWNLVFMQFYEKSPGVMEPLPKPSVDTGSGLERVAAALQGKINNYDTDLFTYLIDRARQVVGWRPGDQRSAQEEAALRVMADHVRASAFLVADGALPSNEGRGYVLRRILRRGIRFGRTISQKHSFLPVMAEALVENMSRVYPELNLRREVILTTLTDEEAR
ncbi:MAG: alanine--tRNA ligase, partial [Bdellovibrio sp.]